MSESEIPKPEDKEENPARLGSGNGEEKKFQRAGMKNFFKAVHIMNEASVNASVKQRFSDHITILLVILCVLSLIGAVALSVPLQLKILPLVFTIGAVIFYIINRLGIVVSFNQRQALIVWQIMIACYWLGVTSCALVFLSCLYFLNAAFGH